MGLFKSRGKHASSSKRDDSAKLTAANEELQDEAFEPKTVPEALGNSEDEALTEAVSDDQPKPDSEGEAEPDGEAEAEPELEQSGEGNPSDAEGAGVDEKAEPIEGAVGFVAAEFPEIPKKKRRRALKALGITFGILVALVVIAYFVGVAVFMGRFLPRGV